LKKLHHLYKRNSGTWYFQHSKTGKINLKTSDRDEAIQMRNDLLKEINYHGYLPVEKVKMPTFRECVKDWYERKKKVNRETTVYSYRTIVNKHFLNVPFVDTPINEIQDTDIEDWWLSLDVDNNSILDYLTKMSGVFKLALKRKHITSNPMLTIDRPKRRTPKPAPFTLDEIEKILEQIDPYYRDFYEVRAFTGMNHGEACALKPEHIDFHNNIIKVRQSIVRGKLGLLKNEYRVRDILMVDRVKTILKLRVEHCNDGYLFLNRRRNPISTYTNWAVWNKACEKAGVKVRPARNTRHTFITAALDHERPMFVARQAGHRDLAMIHKHYAGFVEKSGDGEKFNEFVSSELKSTTKSTTSGIPLKLLKFKSGS